VIRRIIIIKIIKIKIRKGKKQKTFIISDIKHFKNKIGGE